MAQGSLTNPPDDSKLTGQAFPDVLTLAEACEYLRVGVKLLREYVLKGQVPVKFMGDRQLFSRRKLLEWVEKA